MRNPKVIELHKYSVNFVPHRIRSRQARKKIIPALLITAVVMSLVQYGLRQILLVLEHDVQQQVVVSEQGITTAAANSKSLAVEEATQKAKQVSVIKKTLALNALADQELQWQKLFSTLQGMVPQDVVLTSSGIVARSSTTVIFRLGGTAPSNVSYAAMLEVLQARSDIAVITPEGYVFNPATGVVTFALAVEMDTKQFLYQGAP